MHSIAKTQMLHLTQRSIYYKATIWRSFNQMWPNICSMCQLERVYFHTTPNWLVAKSKNTKKKIKKPIVFKPKSGKPAVIGIRKGMTVAELADAMGKDIDHVYEAFLYIRGTENYDMPHSVIKDLSVIKETLEKSGFRFKLEAEKKTEKANKDIDPQPAPDPTRMVKRPPVVTIMGHVDHGKTTLLDALRHSHIVQGEFGGITQHIGAFSVELSTGDMITFLDTPGHAAFSAMRYRGAHATDIVVLVVAADDGVMKQTVESIKHVQDAGVPVIVALNKVDKPQVDLEAAKKGLLSHGIQLEEFGGDVQAVPISALKNMNLDALQEAIIAQAEVLEIKGDPYGLVEGAVLESRTDPGRGKLATVLVKRGVLRKGDYILAGVAWAKVRNMFNDRGKPMAEARPGEAVEVLGWRELPSAGDELYQVDSEHRALEVVTFRKHQLMDKKAESDQEVYRQQMEQHKEEYQRLRQARLEQGSRRAAIYRTRRTKEIVQSHAGPQLNIVLKGDVDGSIEAILDTLETYQSDVCRLEVLSYGVGSVSEHDISMAAPFDGIIYAFNTDTLPSAQKLAKQKAVQIQNFNVIYHLVDDLRQQLEARLPTYDVEQVLGVANVLQLFKIKDGKKQHPVAGSRCIKGSLQRKKLFKLMRNEEVIVSGKVRSLRHFKQEVDSVQTDVECGILFEDEAIEPQSGDVIVCYELLPVKSKLEWELDF